MHVALALAAAALAALGAARSGGAATPAAPKELGAVRWERDFAAGVRLSRADGRPIFLLFQEVPGCATCVGFGESVLSHPLLVEAIETEFVPVAVLNNRAGEDREVLQRFGEAAWNNPVVRFVDADGRDLVPRADGIWTAHGIAARMIAALGAARRPVPGYLTLAAEETRAVVTRRATLETHCFWEGEACVGGLPGVVSTEAAWLEGQEVVDVRFDPRETSYAELLQHSRSGGCARAVWARGDAQARDARAVYGERVRQSADAPRRAPASDQKRYLRASPLASLDLTPLQQTRVNAALARGSDPLRWLSPSQRARARDPL